MKAVVTGGAGFIASHITDALLEAGYDVTVVDDFSAGRNENLEQAFEISQKKGLKFRVLRASIADETTWKNLDGADILVHFAAQTSVTASVQNPKKDFGINVLSVQYIIEWIRSKGVRSVVYANTGGAMYGKPAYFPTDERAGVHPVCPYGATKAFFEIYLSSLCASLKASGEWSSDPADKNYFSWAALRLSNVYGRRQVTTGEAGVVPIFIETIAKGEAPTIFGDGSKSRDYVHVSDVVAAALLAAEKMKTCFLDEGFNIATSTETRDLEVFQSLLHVMHELGSDPESLPQFRNALKITQPNFAPIRPGESMRSVLDNNKAAAILGWRPKVLFRKGLEDTVKSYY